jgi:hypothetical protein
VQEVALFILYICIGLHILLKVYKLSHRMAIGKVFRCLNPKELVQVVRALILVAYPLALS